MRQRTMEWVIALALVALLVYLVWDEVGTSIPTPIMKRKRLCDYMIGGSVHEDIPTALKRGNRLIEVHVYADEQNHPIVAKNPTDEAYDNVSFNQVCVDIANDAFPSKDPLILSIVPHTDNVLTLNRMAETMKQTIRRHLVQEKAIEQEPIDNYANKVIVVSGGNIRGSDFDDLVNLSWSESGVRRLSHQQALHPRDELELITFNKDNITIVSPDVRFKAMTVNPEVPKTLGCQWNLFTAEPIGFVEKRLAR